MLSSVGHNPKVTFLHYVHMWAFFHCFLIYKLLHHLFFDPIHFCCLIEAKSIEKQQQIISDDCKHMSALIKFNDSLLPNSVIIYQIQSKYQVN